jgi:hypothetical protein
MAIPPVAERHKNDDSNSGNSGGNNGNKGGSSTRGGTPEQHAKAGSQSHKND